MIPRGTEKVEIVADHLKYHASLKNVDSGMYLVGRKYLLQIESITQHQKIAVCFWQMPALGFQIT